MTHQIMLATADDIAPLAALYDTLNDHLAANKNYPGWIKDVYPTREEAEAGQREGTLYVAKKDDAIVGAIILNHRPETAYHQAKWLVDCAYSQVIVVHTLAVHPLYQARGVGKSLMDFALLHARDTGMRSIRLDVFEKNIPAIRLYEKSGYAYIDTVDLGLSEHGLDRFRLYELCIK